MNTPTRLLLTAAFFLIGCNASDNTAAGPEKNPADTTTTTKLPVKNPPVARPDSALIATVQGGFKNETPNFYVDIKDGNISIRAFPATNLEKQNYGADFNFNIKSVFTAVLDTTSVGLIDTVLNVGLFTFYRINSNQVISKIDTLPIAWAQTAVKADLRLIKRGAGLTFVNHFGQATVKKLGL